MRDIFTPDFIKLCIDELLRSIDFNISNRNRFEVDSDGWNLWQVRLESDQQTLRGIEKIKNELYNNY